MFFGSFFRTKKKYKQKQTNKTNPRKGRRIKFVCWDRLFHKNIWREWDEVKVLFYPVFRGEDRLSQKLAFSGVVTVVVVWGVLVVVEVDSGVSFSFRVDVLCF